MTHVRSFGFVSWSTFTLVIVALVCACGYGSGTGDQDGSLEDAAEFDGDGGGGDLVDGSADDGSSVADGTSGDDGGAPADEGGVACLSDADCRAGSEWCIEGTCQPCDNDGLLCDMACSYGWVMYERNGCYPCECAPTNDCFGDADCGGNRKCYAGAFCWDWCPPDDPSCCFGNICSEAGCWIPPPGGCIVRGCPLGSACSTSTGCTPSYCACSTDGWLCTDDCDGGQCL